MADPSLKDCIAELTATRDQPQPDAERASAAVLLARRKLKNDDGPYRRDHLRALAQRMEVVSKSEIRLLGGC